MNKNYKTCDHQTSQDMEKENYAISSERIATVVQADWNGTLCNETQWN